MMVSISYTVIDPCAMMVIFADTVVANSTVLAASWFLKLASSALDARAEENTVVWIKVHNGFVIGRSNDSRIRKGSQVDGQVGKRADNQCNKLLRCRYTRPSLRNEYPFRTS